MKSSSRIKEYFESEKRLIKILRNELNLPISICQDKEILKDTERTFLRARIELSIAVKDLKEQLRNECLAIRKRILGKLWDIKIN